MYYLGAAPPTSEVRGWQITLELPSTLVYYPEYLISVFLSWSTLPLCITLEYSLLLMKSEVSKLPPS